MFRTALPERMAGVFLPAAALVLLGLASNDASAQPAPAPADSTRPVTFLEQIVVTGSRYPRAYFESPQALSFVSRAQLRDLVPTAVGDVLSTLPGVDNSKDSPWEQRPVLRGLSGQRVLVLMDGSPMNSARGNGPHPSLIDPAQVERIEVVRGPSSVAYGSDALGGVINIITREGAPGTEGRSLSGMAELGGSTADRQRTGYLELLPRVGRLSAYLSSGGRRAEDFDSPKGRVKNSGFSDYNALTNVRYGFTERLALKGGYQLYRGSDIGIPGLSFEFPGASQAFGFPDYDRDYAHLTLEHVYPGSWLERTHAKVYWQRERRNFFSTQTLDNSMMGAFGVPPRSGASNVVTDQDRFFDLDAYGLQLQLTSRRMNRLRFSGGVDAGLDRTDGNNVRRRTYYDASGNPVPGPGGSPATAVRTTASLPDGRFGNAAVFFQSEYALHPRWTASLGGRYTHYRNRTELGLAAPASGAPGSQPVYFQPLSVDDDALSGSFGVVYEPMADLHLSANVANGYRQPNAQDLFFNGPASVGFVLGNPELRPEKSISYDIGLRWGPGTLALSGNAFYSTYDDLIDAINVSTDATPPDTFQYVNISGARIYGGELEAEWMFARGWKSRAVLSSQIGDITSADAIRQLYGATADIAPLPGVPPLKGLLSLRWTDASRRFWVEPAARASWRTNRLPLPTPGVSQLTDFKKEWLVGDVFAGATLPTGQRLVLGVRNVADRTYRLPLGSLDEPGISFVGSLSSSF
jgi:hemoglobin/transferrin/lactoferrin receptor protein